MMSRKILPAFCIIILTGIVACNNNDEEKKDTASAADHTAFYAKADSISMLAQQELLKQVSKAIQQSGPAFAVDFCSTHALPITDSIARANGIQLQRLSDRNRNPQNKLEEPLDKQAWDSLKTILATGTKQASLPWSDMAQHPVFYKPIVLGMPTCLKCHGNPLEDIDAPTMDIIRTRYPNDLATGYRLGMLRGIWKISPTTGSGM
jgi:hypothetical protein